MFALTLRRHIVSSLIIGTMVLAPLSAFACGVPDWKITKSGPATVTAGGVITYTLRTSLLTCADCGKNFVITDQIPTGLIYLPQQTTITPYVAENVPASFYPGAPAASCAQQGGNVVCNLPYIGIWAFFNPVWFVDIKLSFTVPQSLACTTIHNVATMYATSATDVNPADNTSQVDTQVICMSSSSSSVVSSSSSLSSSSSSIPSSSSSSSSSSISSSSITSSSSSVTSSSSSSITGCIDVLKEAFDPAGNRLSNVPQFRFQLDNGVSQFNDAAGFTRFLNVTPGTHTVIEYNPLGWSQFLVTPTNGVVNVSAGSACAGVVFKNRQYIDIVSSSSSSVSSSPFTDITIQKSGPTSIQQGNVIGYSILAINNGQNAAANVVVSDVVPYGLTFLPQSSDSRCTQQGGTIVCSLGTLNAGQQIALGVAFQSSMQTSCGTLTNIASISTSTVESNTGNNTSSFQTQIQCYVVQIPPYYPPYSSSSSSSTRLRLSITKDANTQEVFPGGFIEYNVIVENEGDGTLRNLRIEDDLPSGITVDDDGDSDTHSNSRLTWKLSSLNENKKKPYSYRVKVSDYAVPGTILHNEVCVKADDVREECDDANVTVIGQQTLPQTGSMGLGNPTMYLTPIHQQASGSSTWIVWMILSGLGAGATLGRKFLLSL